MLVAMRRFSSAMLAIVLLFPASGFAVSFPDVPATHVHEHAIERLTAMSVITGNPDPSSPLGTGSTFNPDDPINRAAMLAMLYRAAKKTPEKVGGCFPDVQEGSWYEFTVCDAAKDGYVQGYSAADGKKTFKPGQPVTRAEAIKLTLVILGIPEADLSRVVNMYGDIGASDWHARYIHTALAHHILPISGQDGDAFHPGQMLERGEAAAYIWNALEATSALPASSSSSGAAACTYSTARPRPAPWSPSCSTCSASSVPSRT